MLIFKMVRSINLPDYKIILLFVLVFFYKSGKSVCLRT